MSLTYWSADQYRHRILLSFTITTCHGTLYHFQLNNYVHWLYSVTIYKFIRNAYSLISLDSQALKHNIFGSLVYAALVIHLQMQERYYLSCDLVIWAKNIMSNYDWRWNLWRLLCFRFFLYIGVQSVNNAVSTFLCTAKWLRYVYT